MARLSFRQGIVRHQEDTLGNQGFLSVVGGNVSLVVSPDPTIVAFIDGNTDYLFTEATTVTNAWGPFTAGSEYWLYWQLDPVTGARTFGHTTDEPVESATAPSSPNIGQMWFNPAVNNWFEFNGASWVQVIRVFACRLDTALVPRSMSINAPSFKGTQVGLTGDVRVGALTYDATGKPLRRGDGKFFTTEEVFTTGVPTGASLRVNNILLPGVAQQPLGDYQVVEYSDFNRLVPASPFSQGEKVYGIVDTGVPTNAVVNFTVEGIIFNELWDWVGGGAAVNDPVYIDATGTIVLSPVQPNQLPVGVVVGPQEILFAPRLFPQLNIVGGIGGVEIFPELLDTPNDYAGAAGQYVRVTGTEDGLEFVAPPTDAVWGSITGTLSNQTDLQTELDGKSDVGHTHPISDVVNLQSELNDKVSIQGSTMGTGANITFDSGEVLGLPTVPTSADAAASKAYVDAIAAGQIWLDPILDPEIVGIDVNDPPLTPVNGDETFIIGATPTGAWSAFPPGTAVTYVNAAWEDILGRPVEAGDRFGVEFEPVSFPSPNLDTSVVGDRGKIVTITDPTPGTMTWDSVTPVEPDSIFVANELSYHFGHTYSFIGDYGTGVYGTDFRWIETGAPVNIIAGNFLEYSGNVLNVTEDFERIFDADEDTYVTVDTASGDTDTILMNIGFNPASFSLVSGSVLSFNTTGFSIETPTGLAGPGVDLVVLAGGGTTTGGGITLAPGAGATAADDGLIAIQATTNDAGKLAFIAGTNPSQRITFRAPATFESNVDYVLPASDPSNGDVLTSDGTGVLSWQAPAGGGPTNCIVNTAADTHITVGFDIQPDGSGTPCTEISTSKSIQIKGGDATSNGQGGTVQIHAGAGYDAFGSGGDVKVFGGYANGELDSGGAISLTSGNNEYGSGGGINIIAGTGGYGDNTGQFGGDVTVFGGSVNNSYDETGHGGNIWIRTGSFGNNASPPYGDAYSGLTASMVGPQYGGGGGEGGGGEGGGGEGGGASTYGYAGGIVIETANGPFASTGGEGGGGEGGGEGGTPLADTPFHGRGVTILLGHSDQTEGSYSGVSNNQALNLVAKNGSDRDDSPEIRFWHKCTHNQDYQKQGTTFENSTYVAIKGPDTYTEENGRGSYAITLPDNERDPYTVLQVYQEQNGNAKTRFAWIPYDFNWSSLGPVNDGDVLGYISIPRNRTVRFPTGPGIEPFIVQARVGPTGSPAIFEIGIVQQGGSLSNNICNNLQFPVGGTTGSWSGHRAAVTGASEMQEGFMIYCRCVAANGIEDVTVSAQGRYYDADTATAEGNVPASCSQSIYEN